MAYRTGSAPVSYRRALQETALLEVQRPKRPAREVWLPVWVFALLVLVMYVGWGFWIWEVLKS